MKELFKGIVPKKGKVSSKHVDDYITIKLSATINVIKNGFAQEVRYWCDIYESQYKGYLTTEDFDWELHQANYQGLPIDSPSNFLTGLRNNGLTTLANSLTISDDEIRAEIDKTLYANETVKKFFGEDIKWYCQLSQKEKDILLTNRLLTDFKIGFMQYEKKQLAKRYLATEENPIGEDYVGTLEDLQRIKVILEL